MANSNDPLHSNSRKALSATISAVCAGVPLTHLNLAQAQDAAEENRALEEVIVTATKRGALNLQDVPMSITAFTSENIKAQGFKKLDDYFGQIPSLTFGRVEPGGTNVIMRGCAISGFAFGDNPTTGVYLDEQPITAAGFNPDPRLVDIERVEALAGPQGTTFGDASQCGTLRIITNKPVLGESSSWVDLTGTSVEDGEMGYDASAMLNLPIGEKAAFRLVGFSAHDAGFIDNVLGTSPGRTFNNASLVKSDVNGIDVYGARAALRWQPAESWTIDAQAIFQKSEQDGFGDADLKEHYFADEDIHEWDQLRFNPETFDDKWYQLALTVEGDLGWGVLTATGSYFYRNAKSYTDGTTYLQGFQEINTYVRAYYNSYATLYDWGGDPTARIYDPEKTKRTTFEVRLATSPELSSRWSALLGAFYNKNKSPRVAFSSDVTGMGANCTEYYAAAPGCSGAFSYLSYLHYYYFGTFSKPSDNWWTGIYESELTSKALFGEMTFNLTDHFSITVGGRWYDLKTDRTLTQGAFIEPTGHNLHPNCGTEEDRAKWQVDGIPQEGFDLCFADFKGSSKETGFVPKLNFTWNWSENSMMYATYSEGFRRGGFNGGRRGSVFATGGPYDEYKSDSLKNYEFGTKNTLANGRLVLNATFYRMDWSDIQIQTEDPGLQIFTLGIINFPSANINGVEADFHWRATEHLTWNGTLGYNKAKLAEDAVLWEGTEEERLIPQGTRLPLMPNWKYSLGARYDFGGQIFNAQPYVLGTWVHNGDSVNSLAGAQASVAQAEARLTPDYDLLNLRFGVDGDKWSAAIFVDNVFDEFARMFYSERYTQTRATVMPPRTYGINFRKEF